MAWAKFKQAIKRMVGFPTGYSNSIYLKDITEKGAKETKRTKWTTISSILSEKVIELKGW